MVPPCDAKITVCISFAVLDHPNHQQKLHEHYLNTPVVDLTASTKSPKSLLHPVDAIVQILITFVTDGVNPPAAIPLKYLMIRNHQI